MVALWVGIAVAVAAVVLLGTIAYGLFGALRRLGREVTELNAQLQPVMAQVQESAARVAQAAEHLANDF